MSEATWLHSTGTKHKTVKKLITVFKVEITKCGINAVKKNAVHIKI